MAQQTVNGVDVTRLEKTVASVKGNPSLGQFQFRAWNEWMSGGRNQSVIHAFRVGGEEDRNRMQPFFLDADEPPVLLGCDVAPNPAEYILHALAACLTTSMAYHAAARGIEIDSIESTLEGDLDLRGFLGLDPAVRKGYNGIRICFDVKSHASSEELAALTKMSPVYDIVSNPVPVSIEIRTTR